MRRRHVRIQRRVPTPYAVARMAGNPLTPLKYLDGGGGHPDINLLPGEAERD